MYKKIFTILIGIFVLLNISIVSVNAIKTETIDYEIQNSPSNIKLADSEYELDIQSGFKEFFIAITCGPEIQNEFTWEIIDKTNFKESGYEHKFTQNLTDGRVRILIRYTWLGELAPTGEIIIKIFRNNDKIKEVKAEAHIGIIDFIHPYITFNTDKGAYKPNETVKIIITNNGDKSYKIDSTKIIINTEVQGFVSYKKNLDEMTLSPGESKIILEWGQVDGEGNKAPEARYSIYIEFYEDGVNYEDKGLGFSVSKARFFDFSLTFNQLLNKYITKFPILSKTLSIL